MNTMGASNRKINDSGANKHYSNETYLMTDTLGNEEDDDDDIVNPEDVSVFDAVTERLAMHKRMNNNNKQK